MIEAKSEVRFIHDCFFSEAGGVRFRMALALYSPLFIANNVRVSSFLHNCLFFSSFSHIKEVKRTIKHKKRRQNKSYLLSVL